MPRPLGGVVYFKSLYHEIEPLVIISGEGWSGYAYLSVRIRPDDVLGTLGYMKARWREIAPHTPFKYYFLEENYNNLHRAEEQLGKLFGVFSLLAILLASLGLFGLASFTAQQRIKEIGI